MFPGLPILAAEEVGGFDTVAWVILFAPLAVATLLTCWPTLRRRGTLAALLSIGSVALGFVLTMAVYFLPALRHGGELEVREGIVNWVASGDVLIQFGTRMDALSLTMTLIVTGVGLAIFVYALGYMHGDEAIGRFYAKFALFVFSMLGIVLSPNFFQTFVFWELVGASSYFLIGYYWTRDSAGEAAKKAFLTNRVGDFGFLLGILIVWTAVGHYTGVYTFDFDAILAAVHKAGGAELLFGSGMAAAIAAALVFCGAMGKSAQFPLHVWLPDAMEGPTPVSALMHAATMVAAGIYMVIRVYFVFEDTAWAPTLVAWLGGITAFIAATMAITQSDIKKVLAYSTLSQLGYMTMALGAGAYSASMFHLLTHAFFKALLFLCAGSVIHACHHEQDMFHMGGLRKRLRSTHWTWAIGTLALCGIPPFAGFWSKDEILGATLETGHVAGHFALFVVGLVTAGLTAFYMGRAWYLTFGGEYRGHADPHESPKVMTVPLWSLAVFSVFIGFVGLPGPNNHFEKFLEAWNPNGGGSFHPPVAALALLLGVAGLLGARALYRKAEPGTDPLPAKLGPLWTLWSRLYYVDDFYLWLVKKVQQGIAHVCWLFERWVIIQGFVNGIAQTVREGGDNLRRSETGRASGYVTSFVLGAMAVALLMLLVVHGR